MTIEVTNVKNPLLLRNGTHELYLPRGRTTVDDALLAAVLENPICARLFEVSCFPKLSGTAATVEVSNPGNPLALRGAVALDIPHGKTTFVVAELQAALGGAISAATYDVACSPNSTAVLALATEVA